MANISSKSQARRKVREAQARANEERAQRERDNVDDAATIMVERGRILGVDAWEAERRDIVQAEAERRRDEHRMAAAAAVVRMQRRGESVSRIAELADTTLAEVRALLKFAPDAGTGADAEQTAGASTAGVMSSDVLGADAVGEPGAGV